MKDIGLPRRKGPTESVRSIRRTDQPGPKFNYELFNGNNFNIRYWSWNYRGCWPACRTHVAACSAPGGAVDRPALLNLYMMGAPAKDTLSSGQARPLSQLPRRPTHTLARSTRARWKSLSRYSARDCRGLSSLGFPDPGCVAGIHPSRSTDARLAGIGPPPGRPLLSLASAEWWNH